jgi:hypothetical protein
MFGFLDVTRHKPVLEKAPRRAAQKHFPSPVFKWPNFGRSKAGEKKAFLFTFFKKVTASSTF